MRRDYMKFTTLLGELGGLLKIFTTVVFCVYSLYNFREMKAFIARTVLNIDERLVDRLRGMIIGEKKQESSQETSQSSEISKEEKTAKSKIGIEEASKAIVRQRMSSKSFVQRMNSLEVIENSFFTDYEKKLVPLVLLQMKKKKFIMKRGGVKERDELLDQISPKDPQSVKDWQFEEQELKSIGRAQGPVRSKISSKVEKNGGDSQGQEGPSQRLKILHAAYKKLKNSQGLGENVSHRVGNAIQHYMTSLLRELVEDQNVKKKILR